MSGVRVLKLNKGYKILEIDGNKTVCDANNLPIGNLSVSDIGAFLWNLLQNSEISKNDMLHSLLESFQISTVLALSEIDKFVRTMKDNGIIEE